MKYVPIEQRFWSYVQKTDGCWFWTGATDRHGYGRIGLERSTRATGAHRLSYQVNVGPIPEGLVIDHLCRNPLCVNPDHLEPVTHRENIVRGVIGQAAKARSAARTHCKHGHALTPENTYLWRSERRCKECAREANRRIRARQGKVAAA